MYLDAYLTPCAAYGWEGGPEFKTQIVEMPTGRERRNAEWQQPRHRYTARFLNISKLAYRSIKQMHLVCRGQLHAFRFRDELDYQAEDEPFSVGDGTTVLFQLSKVSVIDGIEYAREVYALASVPVIEVNGTPTTAFTVDMERGTIEFNSAPANGSVISWTGEFDIWVRFNQDYLPFSLDNPNATNGAVDLIEVPPPVLLVS